MMIHSLVAQLAMLGVASALVVSKQPTVYSESYDNSGPYNYKVYRSHHKAYVYTYETCSTPPASLDVPLSVMVKSIEGGLTYINKVIAANAKSLEKAFQTESNLIKTEMTTVVDVQKMASTIVDLARTEDTEVWQELADLQNEMAHIDNIYSSVEGQISQLLLEIGDISVQRKDLLEQISEIKKKQWTVAKAMSRVANEKSRVQKEEEAIENVVQALYEQAHKIESQLSQLQKRQSWLKQWESKMYSALGNFQNAIVDFKSYQNELEQQQSCLLERENALQDKVDSFMADLTALHNMYESLYEEATRLLSDGYGLSRIDNSIETDAKAFSNAFDDFTCEESLLNYEVPPAPAATPKPATKAATAPLASAKTKSAKATKPI